jgi:hypothetical protein
MHLCKKRLLKKILVILNIVKMLKTRVINIVLALNLLRETKVQNKIKTIINIKNFQEILNYVVYSLIENY